MILGGISILKNYLLEVLDYQGQEEFMENLAIEVYLTINQSWKGMLEMMDQDSHHIDIGN